MENSKARAIGAFGFFAGTGSEWMRALLGDPASLQERSYVLQQQQQVERVCR